MCKRHMEANPFQYINTGFIMPIKSLWEKKKLVFTSLQSPYTHFGLFWLNLLLLSSSLLSLELLVFCAKFNSNSEIQCVYMLKTATHISRDQIVWWSHLSMWLCIQNHIRFQIHKEKFLFTNIESVWFKMVLLCLRCVYERFVYIRLLLCLYTRPFA